ncbi:MAG: hypothetical protein EOP81_02645 [Variovorax sp.]|nr:MAG: hypothetical protein EOP81_02645 [Variovorax sp.]
MSRPTVLLAAVLEWAGTARLPRAFAEAGLDVVVLAPAGRLVTQSQFVSEVLVAPEPLAQYLDALKQLMTARRFDHCVACDEPLIYALALRRAETWTHPLLPTPATGSHLDFVISKLIFPSTCERAGLPVPATRIHTDPQQIAQAAWALGFPLVVKLARGYGGKEVRQVDTPAALQQLLAGWPAGTPVVLQEFVAGAPGSCCALWVRGELKAWFAFQTVRTWPDAFSPSTMVRLVDRPALEPMLRAIGRLSGFHGLGGIDFIKRPDGSVALTEQHARPIPQFVLAERAGIDLPRALRALVDSAPDALFQSPRIAADDTEDIPLFPQEAYRMIGAGHVRALARWRRDPRYRRQLFRDDRPLFAATLRELRRWAHTTWNTHHAMRGHYLNMDRSVERCETMEAQLRRLDLPWISRLRATDGRELPPRPQSPLTPGEIGCFVSHANAIAQVRPRAVRLVLEDDAMLSPQLVDVLEGLPLERLLRYDIVFLDCQPMATTGNLLALWRSLRRHTTQDGEATSVRRATGVDVHEARGLYLWAAAAYFVTPHGRDTLPGLLQECLAAGPLEAFDTALHRLIEEGRIRAAVLAPFLATPRLDCREATTIAGRPQQDIGVLSAAMRHLFFAGDVTGAQAHAAAVRRKPLTADPALQLLADLMAQGFIAAAESGPPADSD